MLLVTFAMIVVAYLIGSISSAILICKFLRLPDPRTTGSKNPGATNVLRISNKLTAATVLFLDVLKGTIPVWGAYFLKVEPIYLGVIGVAACLGHMYPIFFGFKGGKAVATALGTLLPIGFTLGALLIVTWISVVKWSKYSSLGAIVTVAVAPVYVYFLKPLYVYPTIMLSVLIILRHRANIVRLIKGTESKISHKI
ncbi:glycerol-3-phosphate 1-O-acyltransferase PlsY [Litorilituus lipolyticus]|uniref:Glycerol-3-phosphate acyltransferase n=1 Tax=Litorilituus lipolyticus TaxID=2491017 RepID=A0A502LC45_9GAMM|nr:glycerol-3-phosphate 1-O-acyltransferase PlsY [Litorilituus lipolyticus]TPH17707.1 glycerol-3-phosphate 1-O-acyltransferase PlsY [Litorilituus lipolyticus]